jgi:S1-C subfamily serine protease
MATTVRCPCGHTVEIKPEQLGRRVVCPACRQAMWASVSKTPSVEPATLNRVGNLHPPLTKAGIAPPPLKCAGSARAGGLKWIIERITFVRRPRVLAAAVGLVAALGLISTLILIIPTRRSVSPASVGFTRLPVEQAREAVRVEIPEKNARPVAPMSPPGPDTPSPPAHVETTKPSGIGVSELSAETPHPLTTHEIVVRSEGSVALVRGHAGSGTGFVVRPGVLATNAHVIATEPVLALEIHFPSAPAGAKGPYSARLLYKDGHRDLALLAVEARQLPLELSRSYHFRRGEDVTIIGSLGMGDVVLPNAVSRGVMSTEIDLEGHRFYQLGAAVNPGNSGGPAFNDQGQVIGVVTAKAAKQESISFCIPVEDLIAAIDTADSFSPEQLTSLTRQHDVEAIVRRLRIAGRANAGAFDAYISAIGGAFQRGELPEVAAHEAEVAIHEKLVAINKGLVDDIRLEVDQLVADPELSHRVRRDLRALWEYFTEMRQSAENLRATDNGFMMSLSKTQAQFNERLRRLESTLGVDLDD